MRAGSRRKLVVAAPPDIANIAATGRALSQRRESGRSGGEIRNCVTIPADNVARLLEQISTAVDTLRSLPAPAGDNQAPARAEAIGNFEVFIRLGTATVRVVTANRHNPSGPAR